MTRLSSHLTVLLTSVGRRVELLRAFRRAFSVLGLTGQIIGIDADPLAPALQVCDKRYIVPPVSSPEYVSALEAVCRRDTVDLVLPLIDPDIRVLAEARGRLASLGARVGVLSPEAVDITSDKLATTQFFDQIGLHTPRSWVLPVEPARLPYPLFIKPRQGSAGKHAFRVDNPRELQFFSGYVRDPIIQQYIHGPEITADVACDLDGQLLGVVCRQRIEVRSGEVAKGVTVRNAAVIAACLRIVRELPVIGPVTVQCLMRGGVPYFTEINARLGGGVPLGIAAGLDIPLLLISRCAGTPVPPPPLGLYRTGLYITRFDESFMLTEDDRSAVASQQVDVARPSLT